MTCWWKIHILMIIFPLAFWPGIKGENNFGKRLIASWVAKISTTILWPTHWRSRFKADDVAILDDFQHETGNSSTMSIGIRRAGSTGLDIRTKLNPRWKHAKKTNAYIMWKTFVKSWLYWWRCWNTSNINRLFEIWSQQTILITPNAWRKIPDNQPKRIRLLQGGTSYNCS